MDKKPTQLRVEDAASRVKKGYGIAEGQNPELKMPDAYKFRKK